MWVNEKQFVLSDSHGWNYSRILSEVTSALSSEELLLRFVITDSSPTGVRGEALILQQASACNAEMGMHSLGLTRRLFEDTSSFNAVLIVPTGIGSEIGGHAGDAGPVVKMLASVADAVLTHPNVVNASDINELPENSFYLEGSVLSRLLLGAICLQPVRSNRLLAVIDDHQDQAFTHAAINAINAARAAYGLDCSKIMRLSPSIQLKVHYSASSGRATGEVANFETMLAELYKRRDEYDVIAISSVIDVPAGYHQTYFDAGGEMVNPWGGVEAMLTHMLSTLLDVQAAHSPMFEAREIANSDPGVVDARMAAEAVSYTFLQCILKGLLRSPKIVRGASLGQAGLIDVTNVSCVVIPDKCIGIPTLAALEQGIPVIAVRENTNVMRNDLALLPWRPGQLTIVDNYWEAAGVIAALRAGIVPGSVRRPFKNAGDSVFSTAIDLDSLKAPSKANVSAA